MAGTGYVGLSLAVLLAQHNDVTVVDIVEEKVEMFNNYLSPIQDDYIERYLAEAKGDARAHPHRHHGRRRSLRLRGRIIIIVAAPTNYDPKPNFFDYSARGERAGSHQGGHGGPADQAHHRDQVHGTGRLHRHVREKMGMDNIIFSPEFLRESKALYDNLYPSRIIVGCDEDRRSGRGVRGASRTRAPSRRTCPCSSWARPRRRRPSSS